MPSPPIRRTLPALAITATLLVVLLALDLQRREPAHTMVEATFAGAGPLQAGAGKALVELPAGVRMAGYLPWGRTPEAPGKPLQVRALVLEAGGKRVALVLFELLTLPTSLLEAVRQAAPPGLVVLAAATHTHSGPAGYDPAVLPQLASVGRFDALVRDAEVAAARAALQAALEGLGPATLSSGESQVEGLVKSRDRPDAAVDDRVTVLSLTRAGGQPVATVARMAAHPTLAVHEIGPQGDWPETAMQVLEQRGGVALVLQGALGDASADRYRLESDLVTSYGERAAKAVEGVRLGEVPQPLQLAFAEVRFALPEAKAGTLIPPWLRTMVGNIMAAGVPATGTVSALRIGDRLLLLLPAEPTWLAARQIESAFGGEARVVSAAGGYLGYAPMPADFRDVTYSTRFSWFGPELTTRLTGAAQEAARALAEPGRSP